MTRVLIVSYYFAPQNTIGAVRPTKLAKYLTRMGCEVTVLCGAGMSAQFKDPTLERDMRELTDVHVLHEWDPLGAIKARKRARAAQSGNAQAVASGRVRADKTSLKGRVLDAVYLYLRLLADRSFERKAKRELQKLRDPYDAVFSSYAPLSVHKVALAAKKSGLAKKWIADFRDEVGVSFRWQAGYKRRYMAMLAREPDLRTAVSNGVFKMMGLEGRLLYNGFDREDLQPVTPPDEKRFRVVYCGQLGMGRKELGKRDFTPCFMGLKQLIDEGKLDKNELQIVYAGRDGAMLRDFASAAGLEACVADHRQVSRERSLALQQSANLLLMSSWCTSRHSGILSGKLYENMMMEKPIICCMYGNVAQSEMRELFDLTGVGFCWEAANAREDTPALASWLEGIILAWRQDLPAVAPNGKNKIEQFSYPKLASTLLGWIRE